MAHTHLLILPEFSLYRQRNLVVFQLSPIQQLFKKLAFPGFLANEVSRHGGRVWYACLGQ